MSALRHPILTRVMHKADGENKSEEREWLARDFRKIKTFNIQQRDIPRNNPWGIEC